MKLTKKRWTEEEEKLIKALYGKMSQKDLASKLNRTLAAVHHKAKELGIRPTAIGYSVNENFFNMMNLNSAYWAGFIAADGTVLTKRNNLVLWLARKDKSHLEKFKDQLEFTGPVKDYDYEFKTSRVSIHSLKIIQDLNSNFNITQNKSLSLKPPVHLSDELSLSFIIGYLDGDGHISRKNKKFNVLGTQEVLVWIQKKLELATGKPRKNKISKLKNIFQIQYGGKTAIENIEALEKINVPKLERKWE